MATEKKAQPAPEKVEKSAPKTAEKAAPKASSKAFYAVFATGGKQYRAQVGDKVKIEKLGDDHKVGDKITFDKVLLVDDGASEATIGTPFIKGALVSATLDKIGRYKTIDVIKYKQKSRYFKKYGHRQPYFEVLIDSIK
jgi:large subunit ribosomal protein L21